MGRRLHTGRIKRKSATLIELLLALSIFSLVGAGIYRAFSSSVSLFRRLEKINTNIEALILKERLGHELGNIAFGQDFFFRGSEDHLVFFYRQAQLAPSENDLKPFKKIEYNYSPQDKKIKRLERPYGQKEPQARRVLLERVSGLEFTYYLKNNNGEIEETNFLEDKLPEAIGLGLKFEGGRQHEAVIPLPSVER